VYTFGTVALLGLVVFAVVEFLMGLGVRVLTPVARAARLFLGLLLGALLSWALNYSMFSAWGIHFRELWMGTVGTGLVMGGVAWFWHQLFALFSSATMRGREREAEAEPRMPRAA